MGLGGDDTWKTPEVILQTDPLEEEEGCAGVGGDRNACGITSG